MTIRTDLHLRDPVTGGELLRIIHNGIDYGIGGNKMKMSDYRLSMALA
jgi:hypothetical protein